MREILFLIPILFCPFLFALAPQSNLVDIPPNSIIKFAAEVEKVKPLILQAGEAILGVKALFDHFYSSKITLKAMSLLRMI